MYCGKKFVGVITARGGSKGIPQKNIKKLASKPLIAYTIRAAQASKYLDYFLVSTDDKKIAAVAKKYRAPVPFIRPTHLATDTARSINVIIHALRWLKKNRDQTYDYVMILQPTSPFRTAKDIDNCIRKIVDARADSVMSMVKLDDFSLSKLKKLKGELIFPWFKPEGKVSAQRQDLIDVYKRDGAIYLTKTSVLMKGDLFGKRSMAYIMPVERSSDINTIFDFTVADLIMREIKKGKLKI